MPRTVAVRASRPSNHGTPADRTVWITIGGSKFRMEPEQLAVLLKIGGQVLPEAYRLAGRSGPVVVVTEVHPALPTPPKGEFVPPCG